MVSKSVMLGYVATAIVAASIGAFGGMSYQKNQNVSKFGPISRQGMMQRGNPESVRGQGTGSRGPGMVIGEVTAKDDKSVTIKMMDGSSKIVILSATTSYRISSDAKVEDISAGKTVSIMGTTSPDGNMTATVIELNPKLMGQELKK